MAGYKSEKPVITDNQTSVSSQVLAASTAGNVLLSRGAPEMTVGTADTDFKCRVDTTRLTDLQGKLSTSTYSCVDDPKNPKQTFRATVTHGPK